MVAHHDLEKLKQGVKIAAMYYEDDLSQTEIAKSLGISRPTVSRMLQYAKETGIVKIQIADPLMSAEILRTQLHQKYQIDIQVVPTQTGGSGTILEQVGQFAADFLVKLVQPGDVIGLGWGETIHAVTQHVEQQATAGVRVVELKGSVSDSQEKTWAYESINELAVAYRTTPAYLPLPVIFDNRLTKQMVERDRYIKRILTLGRKADIALFTVGTVQNNALLFRLGYFSNQEKQQLQREAVGDLLSRFIDRQGKIVDPEIDDRTIGLKLTELNEKRHAILVAAGDKKLESVYAVLKAGYVNHVIVDQGLAKRLAEM
ncbi:sugar-binding transcriptional regulator [Lentilactobacillus raoultii]|uniref:Sugar-binding transcriptional regulator n=1 Tax=Lentilactobacillus raoultii TaxID=1987503 RepID=A0ABW3PE47_9LACO|nr:sugar-binding transcriptional regulator [Lentilactobacillus raoultii]